MFEEYVPSIVVALAAMMLVTLVVLTAALASIDRKGLACHVVLAVVATFVMAVSLVRLFVPLLVYGPIGRSPNRHEHGAVPASNQVRTNDGGTTGPASLETDTSDALQTHDASAERSHEPVRHAI